eukprot:jgi/Hompol1/6318/HPOL_001077-RA
MDDLDDDLRSLGVQSDLVQLTKLESNGASSHETATRTIDLPLLLELYSIFQFLDAFGAEILNLNNTNGFTFGALAESIHFVKEHYVMLMDVFASMLHFLKPSTPQPRILQQIYLAEYFKKHTSDVYEQLSNAEFTSIPAKTHIAILSALVDTISESDDFYSVLATSESTLAVLRKSRVDRSTRRHQLWRSRRELIHEINMASDQHDAKNAQLTQWFADSSGTQDAQTGEIGIIEAREVEESSTLSDISSDPRSIESANGRTTLQQLSVATSRSMQRQLSREKTQAERARMQQLKAELAELDELVREKTAALDSLNAELDVVERDDLLDRRRISAISRVTTGLGESLLGVDRFGRAYWWIQVQPAGTVTLAGQPIQSDPDNDNADSTLEDNAQVSTLSLEHGAPIQMTDPNTLQIYGIVVEHGFSQHESNSAALIAETTGWSYLESLSQLYALVSSLCIRGTRERALRTAIQQKLSELRLPPSLREDEKTPATSIAIDSASKSIAAFSDWILEMTGSVPLNQTKDDRFGETFGQIARDKLVELVRACKLDDTDVSKLEAASITSVGELAQMVKQWSIEQKLACLTPEHTHSTMYSKSKQCKSNNLLCSSRLAKRSNAKPDFLQAKTLQLERCDQEDA